MTTVRPHVFCYEKAEKYLPIFSLCWIRPVEQRFWAWCYRKFDTVFFQSTSILLSWSFFQCVCTFWKILTWSYNTSKFCGSTPWNQKRLSIKCKAILAIFIFDSGLMIYQSSFWGWSNCCNIALNCGLCFFVLYVNCEFYLDFSCLTSVYVKTTSFVCKFAWMPYLKGPLSCS